MKILYEIILPDIKLCSTLSQIIIGLLFTNISFVEKHSAQAVLNLAESISADNTNLSSVLSYYL